MALLFLILSCFATVAFSSARLTEKNAVLRETNSLLRKAVKSLSESAISQDEDAQESDPTSCVDIVCPSNQNCIEGKCVRPRRPDQSSVGTELAVGMAGSFNSFVNGEISVGASKKGYNCYACNDTPGYEYCQDGSDDDRWKKISGACVPKGTCTGKVYTKCDAFDSRFISDYGCLPYGGQKDYANTDLYDCSLKCLADTTCKYFAADLRNKKCMIGTNGAGYGKGVWQCKGMGAGNMLYEIYRDQWPEDPNYSRWSCQACIDSTNHDWCWWNEQGNVQVACAPHVGDGFGVPCTGALDKVLQYCFEDHKELRASGCTTGGREKSRGEQSLYFCGDECKNDPECLMFSWQAHTWKCFLAYEYHKCGTAMTLGSGKQTACVGEGYYEVYEVSNYADKQHC